MNRRDFIAIGLVLIISAVGFIIFALSPKSGASVKISAGSETYGAYPLSENKTVKVKTENGFNVVRIKDGSVSVTDADCRDKICVKQGEIKSGSIICLPHKLVVEITGSSDAPDAVAR